MNQLTADEMCADIDEAFHPELRRPPTPEEEAETDRNAMKLYVLFKAELKAFQLTPERIAAGRISAARWIWIGCGRLMRPVARRA